jgi:hypothetical protein
MRTHREGSRVSFRDDRVSGSNLIGWLIITLVFVYASAVATGLIVPTGGKRKFEPTTGRLIAGAFAAVILLIPISHFKDLRQWCEIDHETWTLRLVRGPWLKPDRSTLVQETQIRDIAEVRVEVTPTGGNGDLHYLVLVMRAGNCVRVPCLRSRSEPQTVQADAEALTALLWPANMGASEPVSTRLP